MSGDHTESVDSTHRALDAKETSPVWAPSLYRQGGPEGMDSVLDTREVWLLYITKCVHGLQSHCQSFSLLRGTSEC